MKNIIISLLCGMSVGTLFALFGLPSPAPIKIEGIVGIIGIFIGYLIVTTFVKKPQQ